MAKPSPSTLAVDQRSMPIFITLMPMTCPYRLMSGPPELPLLSAALVWMSVMVTPSTSTSRLMADTMPSVSVPRSSTPSGLPMA